MNKLLIAALATVTVVGGVYMVSNNQSSAATGNQNVTSSAATATTAVAPVQKAQEQLSDIEQIVTRADYAKVYNSVDELIQAAEIMIEGTVLEATSFDYLPADADEPTVMTKVKVKVTKSFNDKAKAGDVLTFIEPGGITTKKALGMDKKLNLPQEKWNEKVQVLSNGVPNSKVNHQLLIFGTTPKSDFRVTSEEHYYMVGAHQGKFEINGDTAKRFVPDSMTEDAYQSLEMKTIEIEQKVQAKLAK